jgi:hypothetical protein
MQSKRVDRGLSVGPEQHTHLCPTHGQMMTDDLADRAGTDQQYLHDNPDFFRSTEDWFFSVTCL